MAPAPSSHFALLHEIFVLDACLKQALDPKRMKKITHDLVEDLLVALRMEKLGPVGIYPAKDLRAPGWSFIQPITTSHISGHYFEQPDYPHIRIDVYSCASVNWRKVISVVHQHLDLTQWRGTFIDRQIGVDGADRLVLDVHGMGDQILDETKLCVYDEKLSAWAHRGKPQSVSV